MGRNESHSRFVAAGNHLKILRLLTYKAFGILPGLACNSSEPQPQKRFHVHREMLIVCTQHLPSGTIQFLFQAFEIQLYRASQNSFLRNLHIRTVNQRFKSHCAFRCFLHAPLDVIDFQHFRLCHY